jgi:hypothetical protein
MSASGYKQTSMARVSMAALRPKADAAQKIPTHNVTQVFVSP